MEELCELLDKGNYELLYNKLLESNYDYIDKFNGKDFETISPEKKFAYISYALAKNENAMFHMLISDLLMFGGTFFFDREIVINKHLRRALEISNNSPEVLNWIISIYNEDPSSPFSKEEIDKFKTMV